MKFLKINEQTNFWSFFKSSAERFLQQIKGFYLHIPAGFRERGEGHLIFTEILASIYSFTRLNLQLKI